MNEFQLIERYFRAPQAGRALEEGALGIGDDAAILPQTKPGHQLLVATDTMVCGRHYFPEADPASVGHKLLAVNLSDLAAMGAEPVACTLSLAMASPDPDWLAAFSKGLLALADRSGCPVLGGDTVSLPAGQASVLTVTVMGQLPMGQALLRSGLQPGDQLWVSGSLGDPADAVLARAPDPKLNWPEPRLALGAALRGIATAAIDLSDGLASELGHLLRASRPGLQARVPLAGLQACLGPRLRGRLAKGMSPAAACRMAATGGDDYELLFSAPGQAQAHIRALSGELGLALTPIGVVRAADLAIETGEPALAWVNLEDELLPVEEHPQGGFEHFPAAAGRLEP